MSWHQKEVITQAVVDMLRVNMSLKPGESLLVVTDVPRIIDWQTETQSKLEEMAERAVVARLIAEIATEQFPESSISFLPFLATGRHGAELEEAVAFRMQESDVVVAPTTYSLSHTNARLKTVQAGGRVASMPHFEARMFEPGGPMAADYRQIAVDCQVFADLLTAANEAVIRTPYGTNLRLSLEGRSAEVDNGLYGTGPLFWGNLPAGETYGAPLEGTGEGQLVSPAGWYAGLTEDMVFRIERGKVVELTGGGTVGDKFRGLFNLDSDDPLYVARRNMAELGVGTNPNARKPDNTLEAEKIKGTVHIGIGDNIHMGGRVEADFHDDFVQPEPDLLLDGKPVILGGEWKI
jgi:leucyl aminopeptidase (aminopeptidase T)